MSHEPGKPCCSECATAQRKGQMAPGASCDPCAGGTCDVRMADPSMAMAKKKKPNCKQCIQSCTPMPYDSVAVDAEIRRVVIGGTTNLDQVSIAVLRALWPTVDGQTIAWSKVDGSWDPCIVQIAHLVSLQVTMAAAISEFEYQIGLGGLAGINDPGCPPGWVPFTDKFGNQGCKKAEVTNDSKKETLGNAPYDPSFRAFFVDDDGYLTEFNLQGLLLAAKHPCAKLSSKACRDAIKASYPGPTPTPLGGT